MRAAAAVLEDDVLRIAARQPDGILRMGDDDPPNTPPGRKEPPPPEEKPVNEPPDRTRHAPVRRAPERPDPHADREPEPDPDDDDDAPLQEPEAPPSIGDPPPI